ncbi:unnamed protein product [Acanthoscelides obtectus]|nr:unnamed protein product [Acanthoscelides obtectus]CAK1669715.1 Longitudinals lacking protein, isoforms A/B/D/L [Acanthoscelides obtectus]
MGMWQHVATLRQRIIEERRLLEKEENEIYMGDGYECSRCGKVYKKNYILRRHMLLECGVEPKFTCDICGHKSKRRHDLVVHKKRKHLTELKDSSLYIMDTHT